MITNRTRMAIILYDGNVCEKSTKEIEALECSLPEGFGPDHEFWNVPSFRNRYNKLQMYKSNRVFVSMKSN